MSTTTEQVTMTIAAHALKPGMIASLPHYNHGEPTRIATVEAYGPHLTRLTFVDYEHTNTAYTMDRNSGVTVNAVELEMWHEATPGPGNETFTMRFPTTTRRHDALRNLASFALANVLDDNGTWRRPRRNEIRVNSAQGVAWLDGNPNLVAYFNNTGK